MSPLFAHVLTAALLTMGPFEKNDPLIDQGTSLYEKGQFDEALKKFDEAAKQYPQDARVPYNRGLALHKAGRNDEAKAAFERAIELDRGGDGTLTAKAHYNLGNVLAGDKDKKPAIREYREALKRNPADELARHNLEVLLKNLPPKENGQDGGTPDAGKADAGRPDAGPDAGQPDAGQPDAGQPDAGPDAGQPPDGGAPDAGPDGGSDGGSQGDAGQADGGKGDGGQGDQDKAGDAGQDDDNQQGDGGADGGAEPRDAGAPNEGQPKLLPDGGVDVSKLEAEKLLDSMKSTEKNMQLWRFRQKQQKVDPNGKDW
jgi:tetratricopeptide (TPR) repeat protein